ncbi:MAG: hypothetical protein HYX53_15675 [Chloroflexi bacterium]|nr:hypothetical protein [Chloroflexota bacterium]
MPRFAYAMTFHGKGAPADETGHVLTVEAHAAGLTPVSGSAPATLDHATFASTVRIGADGTFAEDGAIDFGGGNSIQFSELARGSMAPAADGRNAGAITWKVDSGAGVFAGASGYISSNFTVTATGDVTDHHLGSILLR